MEVSVHPCVNLAPSIPKKPLRENLIIEETVVVLGMVEDALRMRLDTAAAVTMNLEAVMIIRPFSNSTVSSHFRITGFRVRYLNCVEVGNRPDGSRLQDVSCSLKRQQKEK